MGVTRKSVPKKSVCSHLEVSENLGSIVPNQKLTPINGKFLWHIVEESLTSDIDKYKVIYSFQKAFEEWNKYLSPIKFEATANISEAQIKIHFMRNGDNRLPQSFPSGVLAYAYAPSGDSLGIHSDMYFNDAYEWSDMLKPGSIVLFYVAVHEIGHTLNASHSTNKEDVLYPIYNPTAVVNITLDTQKWIYNTYKEYGVKNPEATQQSPSNTLSIKELYKYKSELSRLNTRQINLLGEFLNAGFLQRDKTQTKINKIWNKLQSA